MASLPACCSLVFHDERLTPTVQSDASDEGEGCTLAHLAGQKEQVERLRLLQDLGVDLDADMKD